MAVSQNTIHSPIWGSGQTITGVGTTSATSSSALPTGTIMVRVCADGAIWYNCVASASAAAGVMLPANVVEYVPAAAGMVISIMAVTTNSRSAFITPCNS